MKNYRIGLSVALATAAALSASACSGEFSLGGESLESAGENLIEGEIATSLGQELVATCPAISDPEVGATFSCTAATPGGDVIHFDGLVDAEDHIDLQSTNVITEDGLVNYERVGAEVLEPEINAALDIDCGVDPVILPDSNEFTCEGSDEFGNTAPIIFTITDLDTGDFEVIVGSAE